MRFIERSMRNEYWHFVSPSLLTYALASMFSIVDGLFVGNVVGDAGLAAVNVGWPIAQLSMAIGTGVGMGGAVIASIEAGRGRPERFNGVAGNTFLVVAAFAVTLAAITWAFPSQLAWVMGGRGDVHSHAASYLTFLAIGVPFQVLASGCLPFIRNKGAVRFAMMAAVASGAFNIVLDYVFIYRMGWGTAGAAGATSLAMILELGICVWFFLKRENRLVQADFRPHYQVMAHALRLGVAPFGLNILPEATVVVINVNAAIYGGEPALAAYAVIAYVVVVLQLFIQGIGDGAQPLISRHFGAREGDVVRRLLHTNYLFALLFAALGLLAACLLRYDIPVWFGASESTIALVAHAMPIFCLSYLFYAITHTTTSFLYAIDDSRASNGLVVAELLLMLGCVCVLAAVFGVEGIWWSPVVVQGVLTAVALRLLWISRSRYEEHG